MDQPVRSRRARAVRDERGGTAIEYSLLAAIVAVFCIGAMAAFGDSLTGLYSEYTSTITEIMQRR